MELEKLEKELNMEAPKDLLTIAIVSEYRGMHYIIQQIGQITDNRMLFQYIIFDPKESKFYQTYLTIHPEEEDAIRIGEVGKTVLLIQKMMETTVEEVLKNRGELKLTPEEEQQRAMGEVIVEVQEKLEEEDKKEKK